MTLLSCVLQYWLGSSGFQYLLVLCINVVDSRDHPRTFFLDLHRYPVNPTVLRLFNFFWTTAELVVVSSGSQWFSVVHNAQGVTHQWLPMSATDVSSAGYITAKTVVLSIGSKFDMGKDFS
jgi:hypothetical protein